MIYFKLTLRSAKRSFANYLLYLVTMTILLAVMEVSDCIAAAGEAAGFQSFSLPLLIAAIQMILAGYIDAFMLKQRAKEFANYLLMGMGKKKLTALFLWELLLMGIFCFGLGTTIGFAIYHFSPHFREIEACGFLYGKSLLHTFFYFCLVETVCAFRLKRRLGKLQIRELMCEKDRNQSEKNMDNHKKWGAAFVASFACLTGFVCGIVFLPETYAAPLISVAAVPLLSSVFAFYRWLFGFLYACRRKKSSALYRKNRLYLTADMASDFKTSALTNAVFCICFLFSAASYLAGSLMLHPGLRLFDRDSQRWMGMTQISICIVFMTIYYSILSLQQMMELKQNAGNFRILHCMGKSRGQIKSLVGQQTAVRLILPTALSLPIFLFSIPLLNGKLNLLLPVSMRDILLKSFGGFLLCAFLFHLCYFFVVRAMGSST